MFCHFELNIRYVYLSYDKSGSGPLLIPRSRQPVQFDSLFSAHGSSSYNLQTEGCFTIAPATMANVCVCSFLLHPFRYQTDQNNIPVKCGKVKTDQDELKRFRKIKNQKSKLCNYVILTSSRIWLRILIFLYSEEYGFCFLVC